MGLVDVLISAAILAGAGWLLFRTLIRSGGACGGCSHAGSCRAPGPAIVKLGGPPGGRCER